MQTEPAVTGGVIGTVVAAVITVVVAFGVHFTTQQTAAILGLVATLGPVFTALSVRGYVTPTSKLGHTASSLNSKSSAMP